MHKIIESYLRQYTESNGIAGMEEDERFERFCTFCIVRKYFAEDFEITRTVTSADDFGIDGIAIFFDEELIATSDDAELYFSRIAGKRRSVNVRYVFIQAKRSDSFDLGDMLKIGGGVRSVLTSAKRVADEILAEFQDTHEVVVKNLARVDEGRPICELYYITTGPWNAPVELVERGVKATETQLADLGLFSSVDFIPVGREDLIKLWVRTSAPLEAVFVVKGYVPLPNIQGVTEAYLTLVAANQFVKNVLTAPDGRLLTSVFDQNVRSFLGDENPVNQRMKEALEKPEFQDRFAINNNGITLISPDVRVQNDRISIRDYQIVNGCQTSHVLFRNYALLTSSVYVAVKVIEAEDSSIVGQIVQSTNSQSEVPESQFLSISPFAQRVEAYFNAFALNEAEQDRRLYFERRTSQYAGEEVSQARVFDIPKLARCFASMFLDCPHVAYRYPTQVIEERRGDLFRPDHKEQLYYTAALALYRLELSLGNNYVPTNFQSSKWHMLMLIRLLAHGEKMPRFDSSKIDSFCKRIDLIFAKGGKASAGPFLEAGEIIKELGPATRDRLKGQRYTDELKKLAILRWKSRKN